MTTHVTLNPVRLEGYQNFFTPSRYDKLGLQAIVGQEIIDQLEEERPQLLEWAKSRSKNPSRVTVKIEPWEQVSDGQYLLRFNWKPDVAVPIVDSEGTPITEQIPLYNGSLVKLAFRQKPYVTPDAIGTKLVLKAVQVIQCSSNAGIDKGDLDAAEAAAMFGQTQGFKIDMPNVEPNIEVEDDDF